MRNVVIGALGIACLALAAGWFVVLNKAGKTGQPVRTVTGIVPLVALQVLVAAALLVVALTS